MEIPIKTLKVIGVLDTYYNQLIYMLTYKDDQHQLFQNNLTIVTRIGANDSTCLQILTFTSFDYCLINIDNPTLKFNLTFK